MVAEELTKYFLRIIQNVSSGSSLLPILETLKSFTEGTGGLTDPDFILLRDFVKTKEKEIEDIFGKKGNNYQCIVYHVHVTAIFLISDSSIKEELAEDSSVTSTEEKEERTESLMLKLYSQVKTSRKKGGGGSLPAISLSGGSPLSGGKIGGRPLDRPEGREVYE